MLLKHVFISFLSISLALCDFAHERTDELDYLEKENFIFNDSILYPFFKQLDDLFLAKKRESVSTVNIVHIGDSHIQGDYFSGELRKKLQLTFGNAGRGFVFPYSLTKSYNPSDIRTSHSGKWSAINVMNVSDHADIGATGFAAYTSDSNASFTINPAVAMDQNYAFNRFSLFHEQVDFKVEDTGAIYQTTQSISGLSYSSYLLDQRIDSVTFTIKNPTHRTVLHGLVFENSLSGILYHSMGVTGASTLHYLRADFLEYQINMLNPDLIIISFGTNDCYIPASRFCKDCVKERYLSLIRRLKKENPNSVILLTTAPDSYYYRKYDNPNLKTLQMLLYEIAEEEKTALWDLYKIMGGARSIITWQSRGLARGDLIHFSKNGYKLQGELLYQALMNSYESIFN